MPIVPRFDTRQVRLVIHHREGTECVELDAGQSVVVGRDMTADVAIDDATLSRRHAHFHWDGQIMSVRDLGSTNGTAVNGQRTVDAPVSVNDLVKMGAVLAMVQVIEPTTRGAECDPGGGMVLRSGLMADLMRTIERVGGSDLPVLIQGETGTGKELVARTVHARSDRRDGPLIAVNCGAIPANLIESTLFGHERGAFTGAVDRSKGVFEEAIGGTVFLDEIAELSPASQVALLRTLETKRVTRVGSRREIPVDIRVIAASHRNLEAMCESEEFRRDLFYRLNAIVLDVPPLRDRREDIPPLALHFLHQAKRRENRVLRLTDDAFSALSSYGWPGNVRELRNEIERVSVVAEGPEISEVDLSPRIRDARRPRKTQIPPVSMGDATSPMRSPIPSPMPAPSVDGIGEPEDTGFRERVRSYERALLREAYERAGGNQSEAARLLKMPVRTFNHKFRSLGLSD